ncbi:MAG: HAD-IA family hydrolase [Ignavibacteria bacterium]|nr:HAD-IA family hydrolase [Ignavibacteria bacterium]
MSKLKCIIFDMDGTLTDTNRLIFDTFNYIAEKYEGKRYTEPEITAMFGPPEEGALVRVAGGAPIDDVMSDYLHFYRENHRRLARLYPGIEALLTYLRKEGVHLAMFTGKGIRTTTITLEEFGLRKYFDCVITGNDVVSHKPSPEGIRKILAHFNLAPSEALMVGDSVNDVKASRGAGVRIAAVLWDSYGKEQVVQMQTDLAFHDVTEFHNWLKEQFD